ncbi:MAG: succinate dehydrogenase cytochrome b subunit [Deltaproteobacteria bacterium]|nr:succinate dehydrogenase cytochrome b subunit [Deltaproteobacteria bacterium]
MWFVRFLTSSIGKKWLMAVSGLLLLLFLGSHIAGIATLYLGSTAFQSYAEQLHSHMLFLSLFRIGLLLLFMIHISTGLFLFYQNRKARPNPYRISVRVATHSLAAHAHGIRESLPLAARTMPYTGLLILSFIIIHIFGFSFGPQDVPVAKTVVTLLRSPAYGLLYIFSFTVLAMHIHHGIWSLLQTLGLSHPRFTVFIARMTTILPIFFLIVAGGIPLLLVCGVDL